MKWTEEVEEAFSHLRQARCTEPVLITPDFNLPFVVHTDASEVGLGAVLSQVRSGEEHPVTFISRKLLASERAYSTVEKEALAIKWALEKLRYYLLGRDFSLITDHAPLKWMATAKDTNARVTRWFLALQDYRFQVVHRPGRAHGNADALSRRDACLGLTGGTPGLLLRMGVCGNPTPLTRGQPLQHRPRGRVVEGRYLPLHPAAPEGTSTGPRESRTLGPPGGLGRGRSFKGWGRGRRARGLTRKRRVVEPRCFNQTFPPPRSKPEASSAVSPPTPRKGWTRRSRALIPDYGRTLVYMISLFVTGFTIKPVAPQPCFVH